MTFQCANRSQGQALFMIMAVVAVGAVVLFMVFNSGRAVNEKINLVNAADAAAYSGAQITARQLNFMAYTNRAMIANEVAIGHSLSFHMEVDLIRQVTTAVNRVFPGFEYIGNITERLSSVFTGIYMLAVDANTANFSKLQETAFRNFASRENRDTVSVLEGAMRSVLSEYQMLDGKPIRLNDADTLEAFGEPSDTVSADVTQAAQDAMAMNEQFCRMVLFVNPSASSPGSTNEDVSAGNQMDAYCRALAEGGDAAGAGSSGNPMLDQGVMLEMLQAATTAVDDAEWVRQRNHDYSKNVLLGTLNISRAGSSQIEFQNGQLNWTAASDSMNFDLRFNLATRILLLLFGITTPGISTNVVTDGNSVDHSREMGENLDDLARTLLENAELCNVDKDGDGEVDIECDVLVGQSYRGVQQFTYLNSQAQNPRITAFLSQGRCGDGVGFDQNGKEIEGWHDNLHYLDDGKICDGNMHAVSQAEVYYARPQCYDEGEGCSFGFEPTETGIEQPNLFNPFWQVRLL